MISLSNKITLIHLVESLSIRARKMPLQSVKIGYNFFSCSIFWLVFMHCFFTVHGPEKTDGTFEARKVSRCKISWLESLFDRHYVVLLHCIKLG